MHPIKCKNCNKHYHGKFCPECAQPASTSHINSSWFLHDIPHSIFHVDKGFPFTFISLFTQPGTMVKDYLDGRRVKYFRPFAYVALMSAICVFLISYLDKGIEHYYAQFHQGQTWLKEGGFFRHYFSVFIFLLIPITSFITWISFIKQPYNYWEHFLINTYLGAQLNVLLLIIKLSGFIKLLIMHDSPDINVSIFMVLFMLLYGFTFGRLMGEANKGFIGIFRIFFMNAVLANVYILGLNFIGVL